MNVYFFLFGFEFYTEIQDGCQNWRENDFCGKLPLDSADTLRVKNFIKIDICHTVSEINMFLCFTQKFKIAAKNGGKNDFWEKSPVDSPDTLWVKNFVGIPLSRIVSKINAFYPKLQDGRQKWRENEFGENLPVDSVDTLRVKNFVEIALALSISEINVFLCFQC